MLRALARPRLGVILLPGEARLLPLVEDVGDEVGAEVGVQGSCAGSVRAGGGGDDLFCERPVSATSVEGL